MKTACLFFLSAVLFMPALRAQTPSPAPPQSSGTVAPKPQFFLKLIPPRPTFAQDMTEEEGRQMEAHAAYWAEQFKHGSILVIGPVLDPKGAFGIIILEAANEGEARAVGEGDPTVKSGLNRLEVAPMRVFLERR
jgi:uncharacterized protein YciI